MDILKQEVNTDVLSPKFAAGKKLSKKDIYSWSDSGEPGVFMKISKKELKIDSRYQRGKVNDEKVRKIASEFDWRLFGALTIVLRDDGSLWVLDGGHRARASLSRSDVDELPCMVFEMGSVQSEAKAFVGTNTLTSNVSSYHKHRASILAGEPISLAVEAIVMKTGYTIKQGKGGRYNFNSIATINRMVKHNAERADDVLSFMADVAVDGETLSAQVMRGLFYLVATYPDKDVLSKRNADRLREVGLPGVATAITREVNIIGKSGERVFAKAIAATFDKGRRSGKIKYRG